MTQPATSPLLNALERASTLALQAEIQKSVSPPAEDYESERSMRGISGPLPPQLSPQVQTDNAVDYLDDVSTQITKVQTWLRTRPDILRILDQGIHNEVKSMEQRNFRMSLLINAAFTIIGAIIGLTLPMLIAALNGH